MRRRNLTTATITGYANAAEYFLRFLKAKGVPRLQDATPELVDEYRASLADRGLSASARDAYARGVKKLFAHLEKTGEVFASPMAGLVMPRPRPRILPVPTPEDMERLLGSFDPAAPEGVRDRAMVELMYSTGVRLGELRALTIHSPDTANGTLRVMGKGRRERVVPLGRHAVRWLERWLREARPALARGVDEEALLLNALGGPMSAATIHHILDAASERAGIRRANPHAIRRACATHMLANGAHPVEIQHLLGHATLGSLGRYLLATVADLKKTHKKSKPGR